MSLSDAVPANVPEYDELAVNVLTPAVATMIGDGSISRVETHQLYNSVMFSPIFTDHSRESVMRMVDEIRSDIGRRGEAEAIRIAVAKLSNRLRETAMGFAIRIALADGDIVEGERKALEKTANAMDIPDAAFYQMFEVICMLQRDRHE